MKLDKYNFTINNFLLYSNYLCLAIAYVIILVGIIEGLVYLIDNAVSKNKDVKYLDRRTNNMLETRIKVLNSINLGLVFIIAGDIIKTINLPNYLNLIKLIILIGVRELLTIFTNKEITLLNKLRKQNLM